MLNNPFFYFQLKNQTFLPLCCACRSPSNSGSRINRWPCPDRCSLRSTSLAWSFVCPPPWPCGLFVAEFSTKLKWLGFVPSKMHSKLCKILLQSCSLSSSTRSNGMAAPTGAPSASFGTSSAPAIRSYGWPPWLTTTGQARSSRV